MNTSSLSEGSDSDVSSPETPRPTPRVSLPVRFSNPQVPASERPIANITNRSNLLTANNDSLISNVNQTISEVDVVLNRTGNLLINMTENTENTVDQLGNQFSALSTENRNTEDTSTQNIPSIRPTSEDRDFPSMEGHYIPTEEELQRVQEFCNHRYGNLKNRATTDYIGLEAALRLLPSSFNGDKQEDTEVFLEKCEFAISCAEESVRTRILQGIVVRLTGKARQAVKFRSFSSWPELRDALKTALEPQRTTTHLFLELYSSKQKFGESIMAYSTRIEQLQNLILEQETTGKSVDVAKALGASL